MKVHKSDHFTKGWFIGDFEPNLISTKDFEVAVKFYEKGDNEAAHYHEIAKEITVVGSGKFRMNDKQLVPGDIVELEKGEISNFECLENGVTFVVKMPSAPTDKIIVES